MPKQTVCLNMIVKNEAPVIRRCLESVRPLIDSWVIVDTGSTDGTQEIIRETLRDLPGELHERPWVNFAKNRTEALELARGKASYVFVIDADEVLQIDDGFVMPELMADVYSLIVRYAGYSYTRRQFLRDGIPWHYEGVLHEYVTTPQPVYEKGLPGLTTVPRHDGARARDPLTYRRDALVLEQAHLDDPENTRTVFYLAQSYKDARDYELALRYYTKRAAMKGWDDEVWFSLYQIGQLKERMNAPWPEVMEAYLKAYQFRPDRAGPLYRIAMHYQATKEPHVAHLFLSRAMAIPEPAATRLFVERALYEFQIAIEYAATAFYAGDYKASIETSNALLREGKLPPHVIEQAIRNRRFSIDALVPKSAETREPGRVRVVVAFRDPGPELDDCIESLLEQEETEWEAVFVDEGSREDQRSRIPIDPRIKFTREEPPPFDGIVVRLPASDRFADRSALTTIRAAFADPECRLVYGQFREPSGRLGSAEPASGEEGFGAHLAAGGVVAYLGGGGWEGAGFRGTRFLDAVLTERRTGSQPVPPVARIGVARIGGQAESLSYVPMISCLMVTLDRLSLAKRAIRSYADQTWPNRELVIVTDGAPRFREALERYVAVSHIDNVRFVYPEPGQTLGALRNRSLDEARGEIVCQWDDDDCSHPDRLRVQCEDMLARASRASFMTDHLQLLGEQRVLCWVDWTLGGTQGTARLFPGTLMMFRDPRFRYPVDGPYARQGEDSVLLEQIHAAVPVAHLSGAGHLYLYHYHGRNTFSREHHLHLTNYRTTAAHLHANAEKLHDALRYYPLARPVTVVGREGAVFAVS
jgi:glycosyltransferase involved in cell wall biosynthesis